MSENRTGQVPPEAKLEQAPTRLERAEQCAPFVNFEYSQGEDLVDVLVVATKTARALQLAIGGIRNESEHTMTSDEDFDLLGEMAAGVWLFCDQAKKLIAGGQAATAPTPESPARPCTPERKPGPLRVIDGDGPRPAA